MTDNTQTQQPPALPDGKLEGFPAAGGPNGEALKTQTHVGWYRGDLERELSQKRQANYKWLHAAPDSVLVCAIGNAWQGESWAKLMDMLQFSHEHGIKITFQELQNRCFEPYDSLGTMRNEAFAMAQNSGHEYLMMVDNDVLPEKDTLFRLLKRDEYLISPYVEEPQQVDQQTGAMLPRRVLHGPVFEMYTGVRKVKWNVLSMMLWKTQFIRVLGPTFWENAIGADEGLHSQKMYQAAGLYWQVDTDVVLEVAGTPLYPLTVKKSDKYEEVWQERRDRYNNEIPKRHPPIPGDFSHVTPEGVYLPFFRASPEQQEAMRAEWERQKAEFEKQQADAAAAAEVEQQEKETVEATATSDG